MAETESTQAAVTPESSGPSGEIKSISTPKARIQAIPAGKTGGSMSLDSFRRSLGEPDLENEPDPEPEEKVVPDDDLSQDSSDPPAQDLTKDGEEDESDPDAEQEDKEGESKEDGPKGATYSAKTSSGKEFTIPEDAVIFHKVDGEIQEIPLKEHLNIVAGELTVNQRLGKLASFREELKKENESIKTQMQEEYAENSKVIEEFKKGNVSTAFCLMAERAGTSPVQMYRSMLTQIDKAYKAFEGWDSDKIENHFLKLEAEWTGKKEKDRVEKETRKQQTDKFLSETDAALKEEGLGVDQFEAAVTLLTKERAGDWQGWSMEERRESAIEQALYTKHVSLVASAVDSINPSLRQDEKLISDLLKVTNPHDWSVEDLTKLIRELLGDKAKDIATKLSKRASTNSVPANSKGKVVAKQKKSIRTMSDLRSLIA